MGYRFRLHRKDLPGKPDLVFLKLRKIVFVHGCFWHVHRCRYGRVVPKTNRAFWQRKRKSNVERDKRAIKQLRRSGWEVLVVWECWTKDNEKTARKLSELLASNNETK